MGSPSEAAPLRRELVDMHRKYRAVISDIREDNRRLVPRLSETAAELDGRGIACCL